jgi:hypothetical protein
MVNMLYVKCVLRMPSSLIGGWKTDGSTFGREHNVWILRPVASMLRIRPLSRRSGSLGSTQRESDEVGDSLSHFLWLAP